MTTIDTEGTVPGTDVTYGELLGPLGQVTLDGLTSYAEFPDDRMSRVLKGIVYSNLMDPSHKVAEMADMETVLWSSGWMHRVADMAADIAEPAATIDALIAELA